MTCQPCDEMPAKMDALRLLVRSMPYGPDFDGGLLHAIRGAECPSHHPHPCAICSKRMTRAETTAIYPHDGSVCQGCADKFETHTPRWDAQNRVTWIERSKGPT